MAKNYLIILAVFGAVFMVETNDEYKTITQEMLNAEPMPQQTQLFQPNVEKKPHDNLIQYSFRNDYHNQLSLPTNYGFSVRQEPYHDTAQPMQYDYDPEHITPVRPNRMAYPQQQESYDYDENRPKYYNDPENYYDSPPPINRHAYREGHKIPNHHYHHNQQPYVEMTTDPLMMMPSHGRHRRMPTPNAFNTRRGYRRVRRKPSVRGYVYGFRTTENED